MECRQTAFAEPGKGEYLAFLGRVSPEKGSIAPLKSPFAPG